MSGRLNLFVNATMFKVVDLLGLEKHCGFGSDK